MDDSGLRLKNFLFHEKITQKWVGESLGIAPQYINKICAGRANVSKKLAEQLEPLIGVNAAWLLTGNGKMRAEVIPSHIDVACEELSTAQADEKQTLPTVPMEQQAVNIIDLYSNLISEVADLKLQLRQSIEQFNAATEKLNIIISKLQ